MNKWKKTRIDYELWIHRIPDDLKPPLPPERAYLQETYEVWKRVVDSKVCWRVWQIDQWKRPWIIVSFKNDAGEFEGHSIAIDNDCYEKAKSEKYEVEVEIPET